MGRFFALTLANTGQKQIRPKQKKSHQRPPSQLGAIKWGVLFFGLFVVVGIMYVFTVNSTATKGYEIKKLERRVVELKDSQKRLELEITGLKSIQGIETEFRALNMLPSQKVKYISGSEYALNK